MAEDMDRRHTFEREREVEALIERAAHQGGVVGGRAGAIEVLNTLFTHDMTTKLGIEAARADLRYASEQRARRAAISANLAKVGVPAGILIGIITWGQDFINAVKAIWAGFKP